MDSVNVELSAALLAPLIVTLTPAMACFGRLV